MNSNPEDKPQESQINRLLRRAEQARKSGNLDSATAFLSEAAVLGMGHQELGSKLFGVAQDIYLEGKKENALLLFNFMRALWDEESLIDYPYTLFNAALILIELGEPDRGETLLRQALALDESNDSFVRTLGYFLLNQGRYDEGINLLQHAMEMDQNEEERITSLETIVWAEFKRGNKIKAVEYLQEQFEYWQEEGILNLCLRYARLLDDGDAIKALTWIQDRLVQLEQEGAEIDEKFKLYFTAIQELAERYRRTGQMDKALSYFLVLTENAPENSAVQRGLGRVLLEMGLPEKALQLAERAAELELGNPLNYVLLAEVKITLKNYEEALQFVEKGLAEMAAGKTKMVKEERSSYASEQITVPGLSELETKKVQVEPDPRAALYLAKADALSGAGRFNEALATLEQAELQFPGELIFYRYAATLSLKMHSPEEALTHLETARKAGLELDEPTRKLETKALETKAESE